MAFMVKGRHTASGQLVTQRMEVTSAHEAATRAGMAGIEVTSVYQCEDAAPVITTDTPAANSEIAWQDVPAAVPRRHSNIGLWMALGGALLLLGAGAIVTVVILFMHHASFSSPPAPAPSPVESDYASRAKRMATLVTFKELKISIEEYEVDNGSYPTTAQGLDALVDRPTDAQAGNWHKLMDTVPLDSWGGQFAYKGPDSAPEGMDFDIISAGPDKQFGTADDIHMDDR